VPVKTTKPAAFEPEVFCINADPEAAPQKHPWEHHGNSCQALKHQKAFREMEHRDGQQQNEEQQY